MKKGIMTVCAAAVLIACMALFAGCFFNKDKDKDDTPKEYTIQYTDDAGAHTITVTDGMPYSLDVVPEKTGYEFLGLFDAEVGGTQYVSAKGSSLSPYTDGKNMVLFPQFKAKDYTFILDYQGATVTGGRQLTVAYGSSLPELPKNLAAEHKVFKGWYTKENCEGTRISDEYGLVPIVSVLNDTNFDLRGEYIYLYAGFEVETFTVTCCFEEGRDTENVQVAYDTPVSKIVPTTRVNGEAPLTWSKTQGGEVFNGKVTEDMVLYAVEYAPVIELDSNGGRKVDAIVARAGSPIALPTPTKDLAKFAYWEDMQGNRYDSTTMPARSISLKAVWQAKLVFDENGGSDVDDISVAAGSSVSLPTPEKEGFIFAGWYTADKEQYTSAIMPAAGVKLKAGWYKANKKTFTLIENSSKNKIEDWSNSLSKTKRFLISLSEEMPKIPSTGVEINYKIKFMWGNTYQNCKGDGQIALYEGTELNSDNELAKKILSHSEDNDSYLADSMSGKAIIHGNELYLYYAGAGKLHISLTGGYGDKVAFFDLSAEITYPDTNNLYL